MNDEQTTEAEVDDFLVNVQACKLEYGELCEACQ